jgi:hypothetical protein
MPRFFIFGSKRTRGDFRINAAYAFCVEARPDRIYWARGTNNDPAAVVREAGSRILDATLAAEATSNVELITTVTNLASLVNFAISRDALRKAGASAPRANDDEKWLGFANRFRLLHVKTGHPAQHPGAHVFRAVKRHAQLLLRRTDFPDLNDPSFTQRDDFDLAGDLQAIA